MTEFTDRVKSSMEVIVLHVNGRRCLTSPLAGLW